MRRYSRKTGPNRVLASLRGFREWTEVTGQILRDLMPVIVVLVGAGLVFGGGDSLRQLVVLLAK